MSNVEHTRRLVKRAQHLMNVEEYERALTVLLLALDSTRDYGELTESAELLPRIHHRLAQAYANLGEIEAALERFVYAEGLFNPENVVGRAITLRDFGWVLWQHGEGAEGTRYLRQARRLLRKTTSADPRWEEEYTVTEGMLARTIVHGKPADALAVFLRVDEAVRGGNKWIYELDNLRQIIPLTPVKQQPHYRLRANRIKLRMVIADEFHVVIDDLMEGNVLQATWGVALRNSRRMLPF